MENKKKFEIAKLATREVVLAIIVLIFIVFLSMFTNFNTASGLFSFMLDVAPMIVGALAMSLIILTGNIDISAGTILGFVGYTAGSMAKMGYSFIVFAPAAILVGTLLAGLNGIISVKFKVPSIVVTLAMAKVHLGFYATFLPNAGWVENLNDNFTWFGSGRVFNIIPYNFIVAVLVSVFFVLFMKYTKFSKKIYAVGGKRQAAIYAGINPDSTVIKTYLLEGFLLGIAGILLFTKSNEIMPSASYGREMVFITAAVVGGISILGGSGKIVGAVIGTILVYLMQVAMIYLGYQDYYQYALQGIIVLVAVYITVTKFNKFKKKPAEFLKGGQVT